MNTRDKILHTSQQLFIIQGINKTSTNQICREVGIASGTLFVHFKTKQKLVETIYLEKKKKFFSTMHKNLNGTEPAKIVVLKSSEFMIRYYLKNFEDFQFFQILENGPVISEAARKQYKEEVSKSIMIFEDWKKQGLLKNLDTKLLTDIWWGILSAFIKNLHEKKIKQFKTSDLEIVWKAISQ